MKNKKIYFSCASRGRNPEDPSDRRAGINLEQRIEINTSGFANAITTLQKDSYVLEVELEEKINNPIIIPYDDYNSRIPKDTTCIGAITSTIGHSALRNGWKIIEISNK